MKRCCCTLAGSVACLSCPNAPDYGFTVYRNNQNQPSKIIEKYDNGVLIERTTIINDSQNIA